MTSNATTLKVGDRVKQQATHPDRTFYGYVERVSNGEVYVRWHRGFASWEKPTDLELDTTDAA